MDAGGVVGMLRALTGSHMPGKSLVIAEGNSLGRGPVMFHLSPSGIAMIRKHAAGTAKSSNYSNPLPSPQSSLPLPPPPPPPLSALIVMIRMHAGAATSHYFP